MSYQLSNLSGAPVNLIKGGQIVCEVPAGFNGSVAFPGPMEVWTVGGVQQVTTNVTGGYINGAGTLGALNYINNSGEDVTLGIDVGPPDSVTGMTAGNQLWHVFGGSYGFANVLLPDAESATYQLDTWNPANNNFTGGFVVVIPWSASVPGTTNYTTNVTGGSLLGAYAQHVRQVTVGKSGVESSGYERHTELFAWGFGVAGVILLTRWLLNVIGSIGGNENDL